MVEAMQKVIFCLGVVALLHAGERIPNPFQGQRSFADVALYETVLDKLFQYEDDADSTGIRWILRYIDSEEGEMQLAIARDASDERYRIQRWKLPRGARSIWEQMVRLAKPDGTLDLNSALSEIRVDRTAGVLMAQTAGGRLLEKASSLRLELSGEDEFFLDGVDYVIIVHSPGRDMRVRLQGPPAHKDSPDPVIRWMTEVRRVFGSMELSPVGPSRL